MKKKKTSKIMIIFLILISIVIIVSGTYLLYLSNPKRIFSQAINGINKQINNIEYFEPNFNDYTINSDLEIKASGDLSGYDNNYYNLVSNIIKNYSNVNLRTDYTRDLTNKKLFINYSSKNKDQNIISGKYLIEDNTQYYYINGYTSTYINNGNNTYFESLNSNTIEKDNFKYLNNSICKILKKDINSKYFTKKSSKGSTKVTLKLDNKRMNNIYKKVINSLEKDMRSKKILIGYDRDFFKKDNNIKFLDKNKSVYINLYTDNIFYNIYEYEIVYGKNRFIYSKNKYKMYKNNKLNIKGEITNSKNRLNITFLNNGNKKIGNLNLTRNKNSKKLVFYINDKKLKNNINISVNKNKTRKSKYKEVVKASLTGVKDNKSIYNVDINMKNNISKAKKIKEDTSKFQLDSSLSDKTKSSINNKIQEIIDKIRK